MACWSVRFAGTGVGVAPTVGDATGARVTVGAGRYGGYRGEVVCGAGVGLTAGVAEAAAWD